MPMPHTRILPRTLVVCALVFSAACAAGVTAQDPLPEPIPPRPPENAVRCDQTLQQSAPVVIRPEIGGYASVNRHLLDVPSGVLSSAIRFQMIQPEAEYVLVQVTHQEAVDPGTYLKLSATHCSSPPERDDLVIMYWNPETEDWEPAGEALRLLTPEGERSEEPAAVVRVRHLSNYALALP